LQLALLITLALVPPMLAVPLPACPLGQYRDSEGASNCKDCPSLSHCRGDFGKAWAARCDRPLIKSSCADFWEQSKAAVESAATTAPASSVAASTANPSAGAVQNDCSEAIRPYKIATCVLGCFTGLAVFYIVLTSPAFSRRRRYASCQACKRRWKTTTV
ncbi:hypothetical protein BOX15_Mlig009270g1, partial [Macrostomum lignano]